MYEVKSKLRIGYSVDYHNLIKVNECEQQLGGLKFILPYKIEAHSDGDIILHAISESILGALCLGDLGDWFSDTNPKNKNLNSLEILKFCLDKCYEKNYEVNNIDITLVSDTIFLGKEKQKISDFLSNYINAPINLKATRFEENCETKIKCYASCLLINKNNIH